MARAPRRPHVGKGTFRRGCVPGSGPWFSGLLDYPRGDLRAGPEAELAEDIGHVAVGGAFGNDQLGGDLLVGQPAGDPTCDGELARCQRRRLVPNPFEERFTSRGGSGTAIASATASSTESDSPIVQAWSNAASSSAARAWSRVC